jgi:hypothetical protein
LFANDHIQFFSNEADYNPANQLTKEEKTKLAAGQLTVSYAGHTTVASVFKPMSVDVDIAEGETLRLGLKASGVTTEGNPGSGSNGSVRLDDFRLERLDDADPTALAETEKAPFTIIGKKGELALSLQNTAQVKIVSLSGQTVYSATVSGETSIKLPKGLYIVQVTSNGARKVVKALVK